MAVSSLTSTSLRVSVVATVTVVFVTVPELFWTPMVTVPAVSVAPHPAAERTGPVGAPALALTSAVCSGLIIPDVAPNQLEGVARVVTLME